VGRTIYYPGTPVGITEYNWGAEDHINGATAQADVLGIFGREALDLATRWSTPAVGAPAYNAIKTYRNYDGNKSASSSFPPLIRRGNFTAASRVPLDVRVAHRQPRHTS